MKKRGFTLTEVMVVVAIIAVLSAILTPVFISVRESANESVCSEHLHQIQLATEMYRTSEDKDGIFGTPTQMGLNGGLMGLPLSVYHCTGVEVLRPGNRAVYTTNFPLPNQPKFLSADWATYAREERGNSVIWFDINHRNSPSTIYSPFVNHFAIGVRLDGQIFTQWKSGDWSDLKYWK